MKIGMRTFSVKYGSRMRYRSRSEILAQILDSAQNGITKTKIMYSAFLSYAQLKEYLVILTENGLLHYDRPTQTYKTTENGRRFLKLHDELDNLAGPAVTATATVTDEQDRRWKVNRYRVKH
jgi:predicted transcriptional regulator